MSRRATALSLLGLGLGLGLGLVTRRAGADGGYFSGTKGARAAGRASAFTAKADDLAAIEFNPAGLSRLKGSELQLENRVSYNAYSFEREPTLDPGHAVNGVAPLVTFARVDNEKPWQALDPFIGIRTNFGLKDWGFAFAAYSPAGVARQEYPLDGGQRYLLVSRETIILNYAASAAWKHRDVFGVGATLKWTYIPTFKYSLVVNANPEPAADNPVSSEYDIHATVNGSDKFTGNAILGAWYRPFPFLEVALSAQIVPTRYLIKGNLTLEPQEPSLGEVTLRRDGEPASDVTLSLPLPLTFREGLRYRHLSGEREVFDVELDVTYETWSHVPRFTVDTNGLQAGVLQNFIDLGQIYVEKQWRDTLSVALGGDYAVIPDVVTARAGLFFLSSLGAPAYANMDFPSGLQLGGALGASVFLQRFEVALAYEYRQQPEVRTSAEEARVFQQNPGGACQPPYTDPIYCAHPGQPSPAVNAGRYHAFSHAASLAVRYAF